MWCAFRFFAPGTWLRFQRPAPLLSITWKPGSPSRAATSATFSSGMSSNYETGLRAGCVRFVLDLDFDFLPFLPLPEPDQSVQR